VAYIAYILGTNDRISTLLKKKAFHTIQKPFQDNGISPHIHNAHIAADTTVGLLQDLLFLQDEPCIDQESRYISSRT
jgi:hypothetical protein